MLSRVVRYNSSNSKQLYRALHVTKANDAKDVQAFLEGSKNGIETVVSKLDDLVNWARRGSMWPVTFGYVYM